MGRAIPSHGWRITSPFRTPGACCASFAINTERHSRWIRSNRLGLTEILGDAHDDAVTFAVTAPVGRDWPAGHLTCPHQALAFRYRR